MNKHVQTEKDRASATMKNIDRVATEWFWIAIGVCILATAASIALGWLLARSMTRALTSVSSSIHDSISYLTNTSDALTESSEGSSRQARDVSEPSELMSSNMSAVASAIEQMQSVVSEISTSSTEASNVAGNAVETVADTNVRVESLGASSNQIGKVIEVITSIAEQTNLLALNATIEAGRAGEAGKGFAVVANEVKELAKETSSATDEISRRIASIQSETQDTVTSIAEIETVITRINDMQSTIAAAVEEQTAAIGEITRNVHNERASGLVEVSQALQSDSERLSEIITGATR